MKELAERHKLVRSRKVPLLGYQRVPSLRNQKEAVGDQVLIVADHRRQSESLTHGLVESFKLLKQVGLPCCAYRVLVVFTEAAAPVLEVRRRIGAATFAVPPIHFDVHRFAAPMALGLCFPVVQELGQVLLVVEADRLHKLGAPRLERHPEVHDWVRVSVVPRVARLATGRKP